MAFVPNPIIVRVTHRMDQAGLPMYNVMYHEFDGAHTPASMANVAQQLGTLYTNTILEQLAAGVNYEECVVYSMSSESAPQGAWSAPDPSPGGISSQSIARGSAAVVTLRTANRGRSSRGRSYLPGMPESDVTDGVMTGPYTASLETAYNNYRTGAAALDMALVVYSQFTGGAPRSVGLAQLVTSVEIRSSIVGSQRRRNHRP